MIKRLVLCVLLVCVFSACDEPRYQRFTRSFFDVFDTVSFITGYARSREEFAYFADGVVRAELERLHRLFDIFNEYPGNLYTVNMNAGVAPVEVGSDVAALLRLAVEAYYISGGVLNVAIGPVTEIWRAARADGVVPCMEGLRAAALYTDIGGLVIDAEMGTVFLRHEGMSLDVGAVAKGFAVELAVQAGIAAGFDSFLLSVGGDVRVAAAPRSGGYWSVGIDCPGGGDFFDVVYVADTAVFSSGDNFRYFEADGQRFHHIIDPRTLMPAVNHRSVTVIYPNGGMADVLSTAAFILAAGEAEALLTRFGADSFIQ